MEGGDGRLPGYRGAMFAAAGAPDGGRVPPPISRGFPAIRERSCPIPHGFSAIPPFPARITGETILAQRRCAAGGCHPSVPPAPLPGMRARLSAVTQAAQRKEGLPPPARQPEPFPVAARQPEGAALFRPLFWQTARSGRQASATPHSRSPTPKSR